MSALPVRAADLREDFPIVLAVTLAEPFPGGLGGRVSGRFTEWIRLHAGMSFSSSSTASLTNFAVGAQALHPDWPVTPFLAASSAMIFHGGTGAISGFDTNAWHAYPSFGVEWQSRDGFNLQFGYHLSFRSGLRSSFFASLGWAFDL